MIKYLITFAVIIIGNLCFLNFWYKKFKCIPLSKISKDLAEEYEKGCKDTEIENKIEIDRIKESHRQESLRAHYRHGAELNKFENKIAKLETKIADFYNDSLKIENEKMLVKEITESFKEYMSETHDFVRNMAGKSEGIFNKALKIENIKDVLVCNNEPEQQEGE